MPLKERIEIVDFYLPLFDKLLKGAKFENEGQGYDEIIQDDKVPGMYLFELSEIKGAIVIGRFPRPEELPKTLKNKIWQE